MGSILREVEALPGYRLRLRFENGSSAANEGSLEIPGMKVYADDTATTPVQAEARESTCRSTRAKLELCESHEWGAWSITTAPTCTEDGVKLHSCDWCAVSEDGVAEALGHDLVHHDAQEPTCTEIGWEAYDTCSRCEYSTYAEREAIGHAWGEPSYEWSDDYSSVTATAVCANDPSHILSETVQPDFIITQPSTFEQTGSGYYQATFENELFQTQKQEVVIPEVACAGGDECPSKHFTDMPPITNYAHIPIDWAFVNHITGGTSATTFSPNATCTRAQFVTFLWRVAGSPEPETTQSPYKDVKAKA